MKVYIIWRAAAADVESCDGVVKSNDRFSYRWRDRESEREGRG